jgi:hypothetical protein
MTITFLCLFVHSGVQHISWCVVFLFCFSSFCVPMVPVSLDCPFVIVPSVFSNVYSNRMSFVLINNSKQLPLRTWNIVGRPLHDYISNVIFRGSEIQYEHYHRAEFSIMAGICSFNCSVESIEHIEDNHQRKTKWGNSKICFSQKLQIWFTSNFS